MRKEARKNRIVEKSEVQAYHQRTERQLEGLTVEERQQAYAYIGFEQNYYFKSDRPVALDRMFRLADGSPLKGYGLEIEIECSGINGDSRLANVLEKIIFPIFPKCLFKLQSDGSLGRGFTSSCECITQVMTKSFIRNQYRNFKAMYNDYFDMFGICCDSGHCGMHVNISNACFGSSEQKQEEAVRKLYYIVNRHFDLCCALFNRDRNNTGYCGRMPITHAKDMNIHGIGTDHYVCFNWGHYDAGRIELRLVGGQKNFGCFRNTMESVFYLVDAVKRLSWNQLDDIVTVFSGCNQYVFDRLKTKCKDAGTISSDMLDRIERTTVTEELF